MSEENVEIVRSLYEAWNSPVAEFWTAFGSQHTEIEECVTQGDEVVVGVRFEARGRHSGAEVEWRIAHVWTLRGGKVVRWRLFKTMQDALEAAGLSE